jgi:hypothetical protein
VLWFGVDHGLLGDNLVAWHIGSLAAHVITSGLVGLLALQLINHRGIALVIGLLYCFHPVHAEVLAWLTAGRENTLLTALIVSALLAHLNRRIFLTALFAGLAMLTKEHALSIIVLLPAVDWLKGQKWQWRAYLTPWLLAAGWVVWRLFLMSSQNMVQSDYLTDLFSMPILDLPGLILVDLPAQLVLPVIPGLWPAASILSGLMALLLGWVLWFISRRADATLFVRWTVFALFWLYATVGPSVAQMQLPEGPFLPDRVPGWHFRILALAMVGPLIAFGWGLTHLARGRWQSISLLLIVVSAIGLIQNLKPYVEISARVNQVAHAVDSTEWDDNVAVRFVSPQDPAVAFLLYRKQMNPNSKTLPVLVGEPRCGCVMQPVATDPAEQPSPRAVANAIMARLRITAVDEGDPCTCTKWRDDAEYLTFDGEKFVAR